MRFGVGLIVLFAACSAAPVPRPGDPLRRSGDEIIFNGRLIHTTTPVAFWFDPKGPAQTRSAFSGVGLIQRSRSPVARGRAYTATACAPITMNSVPASDNATNISTKSRFMIEALERPRLQCELPNHIEPSSRIPPDGFLHHGIAESKLAGRVGRSIDHRVALVAEAVDKLQR